MGNQCAVPGSTKLDLQHVVAAAEGSCSAAHDKKRGHSSVLVAWKMKEKHGSCSSEFVQFEALKKFSSRSCYGVVLVMRKRRDKGSTPRADPASASSSSASSSSRLSISKVLTTAVDNVSPRGLNSPWQGSFQLGPSSASTSSSGSAFYYNTYMWAGRRTSPENRAYCMSQLARLCRTFESGDDSTLEMIFRTGDKLLRDLFVLDSDLTEFEHAVHLIRDRNLFGEAAGGHMSKSHLRDTKYGLFTRPELAVPVGTTTVRQGGGMVQSKAATGSAAHGSSFENSSDEDDGEDSSSSSGEDDDDSSSSEDEDSLENRVDALGRSKKRISVPVLHSPPPTRSTITEPDLTEGDEFSGGLLSEFNPADDGGPEPDPNEEPPAEDAGHGQRIRFFDPRVSEITPQLYLGSATGARKRKWLQARGITHVVNCASMILKNWWPDDFQYLSLYLLDGKREDVLCIAYDVLEWIDKAINSGGKVYIHCQQGVSRSTTMVELYLMWKWKMGYRETHTKVKQCRNVASPNPGFIVQLLFWEKRLLAPAVKPRLLLMAPQSTYDSDLIVPKLTTIKNPMSLMSNEVYILHSAERLWIWVGRCSPESHQHGAQRVAPLMTKFENAPSALQTVLEGQESAQFWSDLYGGESPSPRVAAPSPSRLTPIAAATVHASTATAITGSRPGTSTAVKMPLPRLALSVPAGPVSNANRVSPTGSIASPTAESLKSVEARRPASPVKLKLNLGTISVQRTTDLNLDSLQQKKAVVPVMASLSPNSSSSTSSESSSESSSSSHSDDDSDSKSSSGELIESEPPVDIPEQPPMSARRKTSNTPRLRLGELQRGVAGGPPSPGGALSPLSSPSLRHRLGLSSPKRHSPPTTLTLEQARRALDTKDFTLSAQLPSSQSKRLSSDRSDRTASPSPESSSSPLSRSSSAKMSPFEIHLSPRNDPRPVPPADLSCKSTHVAAILSGLLLGDDQATDDNALLLTLEVTDLVNVCGGSRTKGATQLKTKTFFCDGDVLCLVMLVITRLKEGKRVLLQGSSQTPDIAPAFAIAFLMKEYNLSFLQAEKELRSRCGELVPAALSSSVKEQLSLLEERLAGLFLSDALRVYQVTKQSAKAPMLLVPKRVEKPYKSILKPTEVVILHSESALYIWMGKQHKYNFLVQAKTIVQQMCEFEKISLTVENVGQGAEPTAFWKMFNEDRNTKE